MQAPNYSISTPENVDLHLELAGLANRILACAIDTLLTYATIAGLGIILLVISLLLGKAPLSHSEKSLAIGIILAIGFICAFFILFGYFILFEGIWQGQTPGKKWAGIRVVEQNGQPISWPNVFLRNIIRVFDQGIFLLGLLPMLIDKNERRFGDFAAGTIVIRERLPELSTAKIKLEHNMPDDNSLDIGRVTPEEYDLVVTFLRRRSKLARLQRPIVAHKLADHFMHKLKEPVARENDESFLEQIYTAYQNRAGNTAI